MKLFNKIKSFCEDTFNFICNNSYRPLIFKDKFKILLTHIDDYYQICNSNINPNEIISNDLNNLVNGNLNKNYISLNGNNNANNMNFDIDIKNESNSMLKSNYNDNKIKLKNYNQLKQGMNRYNNNFV